MPTQVQFRRGNTAQTAIFTGAQGEITIDVENNALIVHDGTTMGGWPVLNLNSPQSIGGDLIPDITLTHDLGSDAYRWKDLYLSGNTLNLGGASIKTDATTGAIALIPTPTVSNPDPVALVVSSTGAISTANTSGGVLQSNDFADAANNAATLGLAEEALALAQAAFSFSNGINSFSGTSTLTDGSYSLVLDGDGIVNIPTSSSGQAVIQADNVGISIPNDVTVTGNLTVTGATHYTDVNQLLVENNSVILNSSVTGTPALDASIVINRGNQSNTALKWNESNKNWTFTNDGSTYKVIADAANVTTAINNAASASAYANTGINNAASASSYANTGITLAQAAFDKANTDLTLETAGFDAANSASLYANTGINNAASASSYANTGINNAASASSYANTGINNAASASLFANTGINDALTAINNAASASSYANTGINNAASASSYANTGINNAASASSYANSGITLAQAAFNATNSASSYANTGINNAASASLYANTGINNAASSSSYANTGINNAASASSYANSGITLAQAAFNQGNSTATVANSKFSSSGGSITGSVSISNDLTVSGNLTITGNSTTISSASIEVTDPLIYLGINNYTSDILTIGIAGHYNNGTNAHTGIIRDASSKDWYIFQGYVPELDSNNVVNIADASFQTANLNVSYLKGSNVIANGVNLGTYVQTAYSQANTATNNAASASSYANTGINNAASASSYANTGINNAASASSYANTGINNAASASSYANTGINNAASASSYANSGITLAQAAYGRANTSSNTFNGTTGSAAPTASGVVTFTSGNGITVSGSGSTLTISSSQDLQSNASPTFASISIAQSGSTLGYRTSNTYTTSSTAQVAVDSFSATTYRSAKYIVQLTSSTSYHVIELLVVHNGTTPSLVQYAEAFTGSSLGTFDASITTGVLNLLCTPTNGVTTVRVLRDTMNV